MKRQSNLLIAKRKKKLLILAEKEVPECIEKRTIIDFIKSSSRGIINN